MEEGLLTTFYSFAIESDEDVEIKQWITVDVRVDDTCQKIASRRNHPELARTIADENGIRSVRTILRHKPSHPTDIRQVRVPGSLRKGLGFDVLPGDKGPIITDGYAKFSVIDRPARTGITKFDGYNPVTMPLDVRFERRGEYTGAEIERDIDLLERMAGRGAYSGAASGPPAIVRVSVTGPSGKPVPLIPLNYQWSDDNPAAPLWRVAGIEWGDAQRNKAGNRYRQLATITLQQHTSLHLLGSRSATKRSKARKGATRIGRRVGNIIERRT